MMTAHTHQGRERRCHPQKSIHPPMDKKSTYTRKIEYNEEPPPSDILSRSRMMMSGQTGYREADC